MHEWALVEAVIATALQVADKENLRQVTEVSLRVGELQEIDLAILEFAFSQLKIGKLKTAKFSIAVVEAELQCRVCGHKWAFDKGKLGKSVIEAIHFVPEAAHSYLRCPQCGSPDFQVTTGRGIWVEHVRGVR